MRGEHEGLRQMRGEHEGLRPSVVQVAATQLSTASRLKLGHNLALASPSGEARVDTTCLSATA